jgi:hypothetical protein
MPTKPQYSRRVVAYIDLLGFKDLIDLTIDRSGRRDSKEWIGFILATYRGMKRTFKPRYHTVAKRKPYVFGTWNNSKLVTTFSDSIVISFQFKDVAILPDVLLELETLTRNLIWRGILCRGGVALGKLFHTPTHLFGPALVEAYQLESKRATFPRIVVDPAVANVARELKRPKRARKARNSWEAPCDPDICKEILRSDADGIDYIDYFRIHDNCQPFTYAFAWLYLKKLRRIILDGLHLAALPGRGQLFEKYHWMRDKYNQNAAFYNSAEFYERFYTNNAEFLDYQDPYEKVRRI